MINHYFLLRAAPVIYVVMRLAMPHNIKMYVNSVNVFMLIQNGIIFYLNFPKWKT